MYPTSGNSMDWALGVAKIKYSFAMELRDSRNGPYFFLLPIEQILPCSEEVWAFHVSAARDIITEFGRSP